MGQATEVYSVALAQRPPFTLSQLLGHAHACKAPQITPVCSPPPSRDDAIVTIPEHIQEEEEEEGGNDDGNQFTKINPQQDNWLPITASRHGNAYYAAFHTLNSGIGFQALLLPFSLAILGWSCGIILLSVVFVWQLYTAWLLIQLHEPAYGTRFSRFLPLAKIAFGEKLGKLLVLLPVMYLSGGTCVTLIIMSGTAIRHFVQIAWDTTDKYQPLTTTEWYLVFVCLAILIAQLPNLNSIAWISLTGGTAAMVYCTMIWVISISKNRPTDVCYDPVKADSNGERAFHILNAVGIIAFAFRGHNLVLEIQGTMPSDEKCPTRGPMWRGVKQAYFLISMCFFPLAIAGYWAYGDKIPADGLLSALHEFHGHETSRFLLWMTTLLVVISYICTFQIYAMPVFDNLEFAYTSRKNKPCPVWVRSGIRAFFGCLTFFIAVAIPFLPSLAGLIGGIALPVTLAYPCFMWNVLNKPRRGCLMWYFNWVLGSFGMVLSVFVVAGAILGFVLNGVDVRFFKP